MLDEDLDDFLSTDDFGTAATIGAAALNVIFDAAYLEGLLGVAGTNPIALAKTSDVPSAVIGQLIVITGKGTYKITNVKAVDDGAFSLLDLQAQ